MIEQAVILSDRMAEVLGINPYLPGHTDVNSGACPLTSSVCSRATADGQVLDLDGEPLTPVTFPSESAVEMTEVEMDALESGEDVQSFQSRYQHVPGHLTLIVPFRTLLGFGGHLKGTAPFPTRASRSAPSPMTWLTVSG